MIKFCYNCGSELTEETIGGQRRLVCSECGLVNYQNPIPSVAVVITDAEGRILLTRRSVEPGKGLWCLPGGFIELGETAEETVARETREETGLEVEPRKMLGPYSKFGGYHGDVILLGYTAEVKGGELVPGDDAEEVEYFDLENLPRIAFRSHIHFLEKALEVKLPEDNQLKPVE